MVKKKGYVRTLKCIFSRNKNTATYIYDTYLLPQETKATTAELVVVVLLLACLRLAVRAISPPQKNIPYYTGVLSKEQIIKHGNYYHYVVRHLYTSRGSVLHTGLSRHNNAHTYARTHASSILPRPWFDFAPENKTPPECTGCKPSLSPVPGYRNLLENAQQNRTQYTRKCGWGDRMDTNVRTYARTASAH